MNNYGDLSTLLVWAAATAFTVALVAYSVDLARLAENGKRRTRGLQRVEAREAELVPSAVAAAPVAVASSAEAAGGVTTAWESRNEARLKPRRKQKPTREDKRATVTKAARPASASAKPGASATPEQGKPADKSQSAPESGGSLDQVIEQARRRRK